MLMRREAQGRRGGISPHAQLGTAGQPAEDRHVEMLQASGWPGVRVPSLTEIEANISLIYMANACGDSIIT
jgi:hypothetical protein